MTACAVIPAAGRGSRLGGDRPKILVPVRGRDTLWHILRERLAPFVDHIHVVVSPSGLGPFEAVVRDERPSGVSVGVQPEPTGMGNAVFGARSVWSRHDTLLVVWGDQVLISTATLAATLAAYDRVTGPRCTIPLVRQDVPYVEYVFDADRLVAVRQSREGEWCNPGGLSDVGTFVLSTAGLDAEWAAYLDGVPRGRDTGELNFLPFMPFLAARGRAVTVVPVADPAEARGINTPEDLAFARARLRGGP